MCGDLRKIGGRYENPTAEGGNSKDVCVEENEEGSLTEHKVTRRQEDPDPNAAGQSGRQGEKEEVTGSDQQSPQVFSLGQCGWETACKSERRE